MIAPWLGDIVRHGLPSHVSHVYPSHDKINVRLTSGCSSLDETCAQLAAHI